MPAISRSARGRTHHERAAVVAAALLLAGCTPYLQATAGYTSPIADRADRQRGAVANIHAGADLVRGRESNLALAMGINIRTRFTERVQQVGLGNEAMFRYLLSSGEGATSWEPCPDAPPLENCRIPVHPAIVPTELYLRTGTSVVTLGAQDARFAVGLTQFAEYGVVLMINGEDIPYMTLGAAVDYDVRLEGEPGPATISFLVGVGYLKTRSPGSGGGGIFLGH